MKKVLFLLICLFILLGCVPEDHVLEIEIKNNTSQPVRDLNIFTAAEKVSFTVDVLPAGQEIGHTLQVPGNSADGRFTLRFMRKDGQQETASGSYLQGEEGQLKKILTFNIEEQGVEVDQKVLEVR